MENQILSDGTSNRLDKMNCTNIWQQSISVISLTIINFFETFFYSIAQIK